MALIDYYEDCRVGDHAVTPARTITETDIVQFAALTGDWNPLHTDAEFAKGAVHGERIAHGMLTLSVGTGLLFRLVGYLLLPRSVIAVGGLDKVRLLAGVRIGDTLRLEAEIVERIKMPDLQGLIRVRFRIANQCNEAVATGHLKIVAGCRPPPETAP